MVAEGSHKRAHADTEVVDLVFEHQGLRVGRAKPLRSGSGSVDASGSTSPMKAKGATGRLTGTLGATVLATGVCGRGTAVLSLSWHSCDHSPVTGKPLSCWKSTTDECVFSPYQPSIRPRV